MREGLRETLARFGFDGLRPGQEPVIDALLEGRSALAVFPTGGGKSLCYQLPALLLDGVTVVVSPLLALMKDQIDFLGARGIPAARLDSSLSLEDAREAQRRLRSGETKLLYVAPERFANERFLTLLRELPIALFTVDEAHCISEWGHNFRPDYLKLAETARSLGAARVLALTATATPSVAKDIQRAFAIADEDVVVTGFHRPNLETWMTPVPAAERDELLVARLRARSPGPTIAYVTLQRTAEEIARLLTEAGSPASAYHAGMEPEARVSVQEAWMKSDRGIVVATIAFGMGIDKANVRYVYHYNLAKSLESYSQEIGRAGRDGEPSIVEMFASEEDVPVLQNFAYGDTPTDEALRGLVTEMLAAPEVEVSLFSLGGRHDVRPLVLRTVLTYLELACALRQATPRYRGYEVKLARPLDAILSELPAASARFLGDLLSARVAKKGRVWYALDPDVAAQKLAEPRDRVLRALEYIEEKGWAEVRPSDLVYRFTRLVPEADAERLATMLSERFAAREAAEIARLEQVLSLVHATACQGAALARHFGEELPGPCGRCSFCRTGVTPARAPSLATSAVTDPVDRAAFAALRDAHPRALGHPRQAARFLCGLPSPATTQAKLGRHRLFGAASTRPFGGVLAWCTA